MKKLYLGVSILTFLHFGIKSVAQIDMAKNMAHTIMFQYRDSLVVKKYINHLVQDNLSDGKETDIEVANNRPANWNYEIGVVLQGFDKLWKTTGDPQYLNYTKKIIDHFIGADGEIRTYNMDEFNIDNIPTGRQLISLYYAYRDKKYLLAANKLAYQLEWQPRTKSGGYWHKHKYPYQMWLDGLYMGQPFRSEYAILTKNTNLWDDIAQQFILMETGSRDAKTGLLYHAFDESKIQKWSNPKDGKSPEFWSRAMGWYIMGLVDVMEVFPQDHPKRRELSAILLRLATALEKYQDTDSGTWWQVTDKAHQEGNYLESSGSSMFVAATLKAVRLGMLPEKFSVMAGRGYKGILQEFVTKDNNGVYHLNRAVSGAGLGGSPYRDGSYDYYVKEPKRDDDLKAVGPFIQAAIEYNLAGLQTIGKSKSILLDRYFNNEYKDGERYHYTWEDKFDSGFSWFGSIFTKYGAILNNLDAAPTLKGLEKANVYIIVDPDTEKETAKPNYISDIDVEIIKEWVKNGGHLLLMTNDTTNAEIKQTNELAKAFGIEFTDKNINFVKNDQYEQGTIMIPKANEVFQSGAQVYVKELVTLKVKKPAKKQVVQGKDIIMATSEYGKGKVFVIGDPWLYNEYLCGRKLPGTFQNYQAADELVKWLLK